MAHPSDKPLYQRLAWFVALWAAGIIAVGVVAWMIRLALGL
jgi:hypothetical protein